MGSGVDSLSCGVGSLAGSGVGSLAGSGVGSLAGSVASKVGSAMISKVGSAERPSVIAAVSSTTGTSGSAKGAGSSVPPMTAAAVATAAATATVTPAASISPAVSGATPLGPRFTGVGVLLPTVFLGLALAALGPGVLEGAARASAVLGRGAVLLSAALLAAGFLAAASGLGEDLGGSDLVALAAGEGRVRGAAAGFLAAGVEGLETSEEREPGRLTLQLTAWSGH